MKRLCLCILPIFRPTTRIGIKIRLRIPTPTRRPRPRRLRLPTRSRSSYRTSTRAHRRRTRARGAVFRIQQALKEVLQNFMLRRARRAPKYRRRRCRCARARTSSETAFHLC